VKTFLSGGKDDGTPIEFGAGQVILVRNDENISKLKAELNAEFALIMTVEQAKGMEFRDVVLYNIFADSPAQDQKWRIFLADVPDNEERYPEFDHQKHNILATELKILYTALTRARARLWIWDLNKTKLKPMLKYWMFHKLVVTSEDGGDSAFNAIGSQSSPEEWNKQGKMLFDNDQYENALASFKRALRAAGLSPDTKTGNILLCEAYIFRDRAQGALSANDQSQAKQLFEAAGRSFSEANTTKKLSQTQLQDAARCFENASNYPLACEMYSYMKNPTASAVECYRKVKRYDLAGKALEALRRPKEALLEYMSDNRLITDAVRVVRDISKSDKVDGQVLDNITNVALAVIPPEEVEQRKAAILILNDGDKKKALLRSEGMFKELVKVHQQLNELPRSALVLDIDLGKLEDAASIYMQIPQIELPGAFIRAVDCQVRSWFTKFGSVIEESFNMNKVDYKPLRPGDIPESLKVNLQKIASMKGKMSTTNAGLVENRLVEFEAIEMYPVVNAGGLEKSKSLGELHIALKLLLSSHLISIGSPSNMEASKSNHPVAIMNNMTSFQATLTAFIQLAISSKVMMSAVKGIWPPPSQIFDVDNSQIASLIRKFTKNSVEQDIVLQLEHAFHCITGHKRTRRITPLAVFAKPAIQWLQQARGVVFDQAQRVDCEVSTLTEAADISLRSVLFAAAESVFDSCLALAGLGPVCLYAAFYEGKCHQVATCSLAHTVSPNFDKTKLDIAKSLMASAWLMTKVAPTSAKEKSFIDAVTSDVVENFIRSLRPWSRGHIRFFSKADLIILKESYAVDLVTDHMRRVWLRNNLLVADITESNARVNFGTAVDIAFHSRLFGENVKTLMTHAFQNLSQGLKDKPISSDVDKALASLYQIVYPDNLATFAVSVSNVLHSLSAKWAVIYDWSGILQFFELATTILLITTRNQLLLPRRYLRDIGVAGYVKLLSGGWAGGPTKEELVERINALLANNTPASDDDRLRLAFVSMLLTQDKNPWKPRHGIPQWMTDSYPWPLMKRIGSAGQDGLVLIWRDEVQSNSWTSQALKVAKWHLRIDTMLGSADIVSSITEVDASTRIGLGSKAKKTAHEKPAKKKKPTKKKKKEAAKLVSSESEPESESMEEDDDLPSLLSASDSDPDVKNKALTSAPKEKKQTKPKPVPREDLPPLLTDYSSDSSACAMPFLLDTKQDKPKSKLLGLSVWKKKPLLTLYAFRAATTAEC
jgi:tetratricopeptide (TPR) repeat protein